MGFNILTCIDIESRWPDARNAMAKSVMNAITSVLSRNGFPSDFDPILGHSSWKDIAIIQ